MVRKDIVQKALFELIQIGLNESESLSVNPSDKEWRDIFQLAQKQSMEGICYAGLQQIDGKCRPTQDLLYVRGQVPDTHLQIAYLALWMIPRSMSVSRWS